ncbi:MAG: hypothetical protein ACTSWY_03450 [Promethearchaeota archaeon]
MPDKSKLEVLFSRAYNKVDNFYNIPGLIEWILEETERKRKLFPFFKKKIRFSYSAYQSKRKERERSKNKDIDPSRTDDLKNILNLYYGDLDRKISDKKVTASAFDKIIPRESEFSSLPFFAAKIEEFFTYYFNKIFPFKNKLIISKKAEIIYKDLIFDCNYKFEQDEIKAFQNFKQRFHIDEEPLETVIELFFAVLVHTFGVLIAKIIEENFLVEIMCANIEIHEKITEEKKTSINFHLCVRQREGILNKFYFRSQLFHFAESFRKVPKEIVRKLRTENDLIYLLSLSRYPTILPYIEATLGYIHKKCITLNHITPVLDFMNFILSRVEDSKRSTEELLNELFISRKIGKKKKEALTQLFNFTNKNAVLFATFQSNNRSQLREQFQLFIASTQYFIFGAKLEYEEERKENVFLEKRFKKEIRDLFKDYPNNKLLFKSLQNFLINAIAMPVNEGIDVFFENIFKSSLIDINGDFFKTLVYSLNVKLFNEIKRVNTEIMGPEDQITFEFYVDFLMNFLSYIIRTIFISSSPSEATNNFRDKIGRYSPKNLALRTIELLMFKELPVSDRIWMNFGISRNRKQIKKIFSPWLTIPEDFFYSQKKMLQITMLYQYGLDKRVLLEEFLINRILSPYFGFIKQIILKIKSENLSTRQEIENKLWRIIHDIISWSIIDEQTLNSLELFSEWLVDLLLDDVLEIINS